MAGAPVRPTPRAADNQFWQQIESKQQPAAEQSSTPAPAAASKGRGVKRAAAEADESSDGVPSRLVLAAQSGGVPTTLRGFCCNTPTGFVTLTSVLVQAPRRRTAPWTEPSACSSRTLARRRSTGSDSGCALRPGSYACNPTAGSPPTASAGEV